MTNKHTPGPWVAGRSDMQTLVDGYTSKWIYGPDDCYPAVASGRASDNWDEDMANARLIAASPKLLAACEKLVEAQRRADAGESDGFGEYVDAVELARSALAEVKG